MSEIRDGPAHAGQLGIFAAVQSGSHRPGGAGKAAAYLRHADGLHHQRRGGAWSAADWRLTGALLQHHPQGYGAV